MLASMAGDCFGRSFGAVRKPQEEFLMDATINRSVDVGPTRARPGLALVLALLSVPWSTIVWDLDVPVPGF